MRPARNKVGDDHRAAELPHQQPARVLAPSTLRKLRPMTREPRVRKQALEPIANIEAVTAADVRAFAQKYVAGREPLSPSPGRPALRRPRPRPARSRRAIAELI